MAIEPWAARLHMPTLTPAAASDLISKQVHDKYDQYKYMFEGWFPRPSWRRRCATPRTTSWSNQLHMKTAAIMSEDADWTKPLDDGYQKCLPGAGLKVVDLVDVQPRHDRLHADLQWDRRQAARCHHHRHRPCRRAADGAVARPAGADPAWRHQRAGHATDTFWKDTNGATNGVITQTGNGAGARAQSC